jgi:hypothetical protein
MPKKTPAAAMPEVVARYSLNAAAGVAYEARRQLRIAEGKRDDVPWEFLDNAPRFAFLDLCKDLRNPIEQNEVDSTEVALMRGIILLLS